MSDSDEDYMSDKLLVGCEKEDLRPGLLFNKSQKRQHELYKKQQEEREKRPKTYHEQEQEVREKGLSTAISSENKGFKMLEKMGYKAGSGLGRTVTGITEPVAVKPKDDASGVGRESHVKEAIQKKREYKETSFRVKEEEFRSSNAERRYLKTLQKDYRKAQRTCEELDIQSNVESPQMPFFWSKAFQESLKKKKSTEDESEEETEEDAEEEQISEPRLCDMIMYLRRQYSYCMYCGDYIEQGTVSCPGYFRKDHDE